MERPSATNAHPHTTHPERDELEGFDSTPHDDDDDEEIEKSFLLSDVTAFGRKRLRELRRSVSPGSRENWSRLLSRPSVVEHYLFNYLFEDGDDEEEDDDDEEKESSARMTLKEAKSRVATLLLLVRVVPPRWQMKKSIFEMLHDAVLARAAPETPAQMHAMLMRNLALSHRKRTAFLEVIIFELHGTLTGAEAATLADAYPTELFAVRLEEMTDAEAATDRIMTQLCERKGFTPDEAEEWIESWIAPRYSALDEEEEEDAREPIRRHEFDRSFSSPRAHLATELELANENLTHDGIMHYADTGRGHLTNAVGLLLRGPLHHPELRVSRLVETLCYVMETSPSRKWRDLVEAVLSRARDFDFGRVATEEHARLLVNKFVFGRCLLRVEAVASLLLLFRALGYSLKNMDPFARLSKLYRWKRLEWVEGVDRVIESLGREGGEEGEVY